MVSYTMNLRVFAAVRFQRAPQKDATDDEIYGWLKCGAIFRPMSDVMAVAGPSMKKPRKAYSPSAAGWERAKIQVIDVTAEVFKRVPI